jgi:putative ABC transport system substrate-binding protein
VGFVTVLSRRAFVGGGVGLGAATIGLVIASAAGRWVSISTPTKVPRIGFLAPAPREARSDRVDAFLQGLQALGYVENDTIKIEWRFTADDPEAPWAELTAGLLSLPVDMIVIEGTTVGAEAVKRTTSTVPLLAVAVAQPFESGLVASMARPGGNLTALSNSVPGIWGKKVELLRELMPSLDRLAVFVGEGASGEVLWRETQAGGERFGIEVQRIEVQTSADLG